MDLKFSDLEVGMYVEFGVGFAGVARMYGEITRVYDDEIIKVDGNDGIPVTLSKQYIANHGIRRWAPRKGDTFWFVSDGGSVKSLEAASDHRSAPCVWHPTQGAAERMKAKLWAVNNPHADATEWVIGDYVEATDDEERNYGEILSTPDTGDYPGLWEIGTHMGTRLVSPEVVRRGGFTDWVPRDGDVWFCGCGGPHCEGEKVWGKTTCPDAIAGPPHPTAWAAKYMVGDPPAVEAPKAFDPVEMGRQVAQPERPMLNAILNATEKGRPSTRAQVARDILAAEESKAHQPDLYRVWDRIVFSKSRPDDARGPWGFDADGFPFGVCVIAEVDKGVVRAQGGYGMMAMTVEFLANLEPAPRHERDVDGVTWVRTADCGCGGVQWMRFADKLADEVRCEKCDGGAPGDRLATEYAVANPHRTTPTPEDESPSEERPGEVVHAWRFDPENWWRETNPHALASHIYNDGTEAQRMALSGLLMGYWQKSQQDPGECTHEHEMRPALHGAMECAVEGCQMVNWDGYDRPIEHSVAAIYIDTEIRRRSALPRGASLAYLHQREAHEKEVEEAKLTICEEIRAAVPMYERPGVGGVKGAWPE